MLALVVFAAGLAPSPVSAQAWVPAPGVGSVDLSFQRIDNTGHLLSDGSLIPDGKSIDTSVYLEIETALTNRLVVRAGMPYVLAKYVGPGPGPFGLLPVDACRCWHSGFQDVGVTARVNLYNGRFGLTPSISVGVPSHAYQFQGESVVGRDLKELRLGVDAGRRLDAISPRLSIEGRYSYAFVERVLDVPNNRSNAAIEGAYLVARHWSIHGGVSWQRTHGGLRIGAPPPFDLQPPGDVNTPDRVLQHDRLLRDNYWHAAGGASYSFPAIDVYVSYTDYLKGTDSHAGHVFTAGLSWPLDFRGR
jgi:hypothetical protein